MTLLSVEQLAVQFPYGEKRFPVLDEVSFHLAFCSKTAVIGETGCGKSIMAAAVAGLLPVGAIIRGAIHWQDSLLTEDYLRRIRGKELAFMPQNPAASLNPVLTVGCQLAESVRRAQPQLSKQATKEAAISLLDAVDLPQPSAVYRAYPHQLSGGMAQRVLLATAMAGKPLLIVADEPTKGLDMFTRNCNVALLHKTAEQNSLLLITHDLEVAATCNSVIVMYAGEIVETDRAEEVLIRPAHPYTRQLICAHPAHGLRPIPGSAPSLTTVPSGCRFAPRCNVRASLTPAASRCCQEGHPALAPVGSNWVRCWYA